MIVDRDGEKVNSRQNNASFTDIIYANSWNITASGYGLHYNKKEGVTGELDK